MRKARHYCCLATRLRLSSKGLDCPQLARGGHARRGGCKQGSGRKPFVEGSQSVLLVLADMATSRGRRRSCGMTGMDGVRLDGTARNHRRYARPWRGGGIRLDGTARDHRRCAQPRAPRERARLQWGSGPFWPVPRGRGSPESARPPATGRSNFTQVEGRGRPRWWLGGRAETHVSGTRDDGAHTPGWLRGANRRYIVECVGSGSGLKTLIQRLKPAAHEKVSCSLRCPLLAPRGQCTVFSSRAVHGSHQQRSLRRVPRGSG